MGLIPPLTLGKGGPQESIAIFYNKAKLFFTGPYLWSGGDRGQAFSEGDSQYIRASSYGKNSTIEENDWLGDNIIPSGYTNGGRKESSLAGQFVFKDDYNP